MRRPGRDGSAMPASFGGSNDAHGRLPLGPLRNADSRFYLLNLTLDRGSPPRQRTKPTGVVQRKRIFNAGRAFRSLSAPALVTLVSPTSTSFKLGTPSRCTKPASETFVKDSTRCSRA